MKLLLTLVLVGLAMGFSEPDQPKNEPFAVVELFASEGCSSCPSAEDFFHQEMVHRTDENVLFLAFHVDYFNGSLPGPCGNSAWHDRFSSPQFTDHQQFYSHSLKSPHLLTPQFIFNGQKCTYSGSKAFNVPYQNDSMRAITQSFLTQKLETSLKLNKPKVNKGQRKVKVKFSVSLLPIESRVCIFLIESGLKSEITAGENCGKTLTHQNVVRSMVPFFNKERGEAWLEFPKDAVLQNLHIAAYAQNSVTGKIVAIDKGHPLWK